MRNLHNTTLQSKRRVSSDSCWLKRPVLPHHTGANRASTAAAVCCDSVYSPSHCIVPCCVEHVWQGVSSSSENRNLKVDVKLTASNILRMNERDSQFTLLYQHSSWHAMNCITEVKQMFELCEWHHCMIEAMLQLIRRVPSDSRIYWFVMREETRPEIFLFPVILCRTNATSRRVMHRKPRAMK